MSKSKKQLEIDIQIRHQELAKRLLVVPEYMQLITEYEALDIFGEKLTSLHEEESSLMKSLPLTLPATITKTSPVYKTVQRYQEVREEIDALTDRRRELGELIRQKWQLPYPYTKGHLLEVAAGRDRFLLKTEDLRFVEIVQQREPRYRPVDPAKLSEEERAFCPHHSEVIDDGFLDQDGYLHLRIKPGTPRDILHHLIDVHLNIYEPPRKKTQYRGPETPKRWREKGVIDHFDIWHRVCVEGKSPYLIAQELTGIYEKPADNKEVGSTYNQVLRALKRSTRKMEPKP